VTRPDRTPRGDGVRSVTTDVTTPEVNAARCTNTDDADTAAHQRVCEQYLPVHYFAREVEAIQRVTAAT
jgi:hypothetical protein